MSRIGDLEQNLINAAVREVHSKAMEAPELRELLKAIQALPGWVRRTWADVRAGDTVCLPGTEHTATVDGPPVRLPWHVHPKSGKYEAIPAEWSEIRVRLAGRDGVLSMDPAGEVDILLTAAEVAAIEALGGWEHRA